VEGKTQSMGEMVVMALSRAAMMDCVNAANHGMTSGRAALLVVAWGRIMMLVMGWGGAMGLAVG
jgi:hypothetical protein